MRYLSDKAVGCPSVSCRLGSRRIWAAKRGQFIKSRTLSETANTAEMERSKVRVTGARHRAEEIMKNAIGCLFLLSSSRSEPSHVNRMKATATERHPSIT